MTDMDWQKELAANTPAPDWAFVTASNIGLASMGILRTDLVAAALRDTDRKAELRGRAIGMREAAEIAELGVTYIQNSGLKGGEPNAYESASRQAGERIREAASKLDSSTD